MVPCRGSSNVARRSAVFPPPASRRTAVLRAGPPRQRSRTSDRIAGVLGVLFLVLAGFMVDALPEKDVVLPQFRVAFTTLDQVQMPTQRVDHIEHGGTWEAAFDVETDNVFSIALEIAVEDDQPSSLPDRFSLALFSPNGTQVGQTHVIDTNDPRERDPDQAVENATGSSPAYFSPPETLNLPFSIIQRPTDVVIEGEDEDDTLDDVADRLLPQHQIATAGTWTVRVTLEEAGGCPPPSQEDLRQALACNQDLGPSGQDPGNGFAVTLFKYTAYSAEVVPLDA